MRRYHLMPPHAVGLFFREIALDLIMRLTLPRR
jgi:hypothetical protein